MGKMELEVKILDIDEQQIIDTIIKNGGKLKEETKQTLYTYDLPSIYGRYLDIKLLINEYYKSKMENKLIAQIDRLKQLFFEIDNLLNKEGQDEIKKRIGTNKLQELLKKEREELIKILNKKELNTFLERFHNNDKKWIRLRKTNNKTILTVKHILRDNDTKIQQMMEKEIEVPSIEDADNLLETLGFSHKSYQEKIRKTYILKGYEIDIDTWPMLNTFIEVEGKNEKDIEKIINILGYELKDTISCTVDEIYKQNGIDSLMMREIKF